MPDALKDAPRRKGGPQKRTFEKYERFLVGKMSAPEFAKAAGLANTTARTVLADALARGLVHISGERKGLTWFAALYSVGPDPAPPKRRTAVGETDRDSGLVRLRELARLGPVNPYVQLEWAGERAR
ncbi:hypothetical protein [Caballeronia zhejiangensis]|uniref:Uncharacterized protein n=1 Tax=Caballeronia zhejiangensis TaxID=871203 RepID=A0A656QAH9_9BURK|nr:hypothetical protein [Caballeronia zhejiangensis]KDR25979.1 hypothetical protein BG60_26235 [Caballeronia zhejiangensis]